MRSRLNLWRVARAGAYTLEHAFITRPLFLQVPVRDYRINAYAIQLTRYA